MPQAKTTNSQASPDSDGSRPSPSPALSPWLTWAGLAGLVLVAAAVRLYLFVGIVQRDSYRYIELSRHVLSGGSIFAQDVFWAASRLSVMLPLIASNALFGYGEHVSVAWPLACSLGSVVVAFLIGRELWDEKAGLVAALVMALVPIEVEMATRLLPDSIVVFFSGLAVYFSILSLKRDRLWRMWSLGSGAALGVAYFARVNALIFLPLVMCTGLVLDRSRWKRPVLAVAGVAVTLLVAALFFWIGSGDPLLDWRSSISVYAKNTRTVPFVRDGTFAQQFIRNPSLSWITLAIALGLLVTVIRRKKEDLFVLLWATGLYAYLEFLSPLHRLHVRYRYAEMLALPAALALSAAVLFVTRKLPRVARPLIIATLCGLLVFLLMPLGQSIPRIRGNTLWRADKAIATKTAGLDGRIYSDNAWVLLPVNYYSGFALRPDTMAPLSAKVNRNARLIYKREVSWPPSDSRFYLLAVRRRGGGWFAWDGSRDGTATAEPPLQPLDRYEMTELGTSLWYRTPDGVFDLVLFAVQRLP